MATTTGARESIWYNGEPVEPNEEDDNEVEEGSDFFDGEDGESEAVGLGSDPECEFNEEQEG
jgi:hypothetical protein